MNRRVYYALCKVAAVAEEAANAGNGGVTGAFKGGALGAAAGANGNSAPGGRENGIDRAVNAVGNTVGTAVGTAAGTAVGAVTGNPVFFPANTVDRAVKMFTTPGANTTMNKTAAKAEKDIKSAMETGAFIGAGAGAGAGAGITIGQEYLQPKLMQDPARFRRSGEWLADRKAPIFGAPAAEVAQAEAAVRARYARRFTPKKVLGVTKGGALGGLAGATVGGLSGYAISKIINAVNKRRNA